MPELVISQSRGGIEKAWRESAGQRANYVRPVFKVRSIRHLLESGLRKKGDQRSNYTLVLSSAGRCHCLAVRRVATLCRVL